MGNWETGWDRDVLERIMALLFALAGLADLAAGAPLLRRRQVLKILSHGEADARAFLIGMAGDAPTDTPERTGDAARLAVRLRALALMLCMMLAQTALSSLPSAITSRTDRQRPAAPAGRQAPAQALDTS